MLTSTRTILAHARANNYAVGHFNINNMEILQGVVKAAEKSNAPVIIATSEGAIAYAGMEYLVCMVMTAATESSIPLALHLDHGRDLNIIKQAIDSGYSSVMFDGSHLPFKKNVEITQKLVKKAHRKGVSVEAELGTIGGTEDTVSAKKIVYTDPGRAREFVRRTKCDFLAIAIGTSHGAYKFRGKADLRQDLLKKINQAIKVPLVLHGASGVPTRVVKQAEKYGAQLHGVYGVPDKQIKLAIKNGINKINTDTDLRLAFDAAIRKFLVKKPHDFDPRHILNSAREEIASVVQERIKIFGSKGKA
jgi:fructose-bisphosphate aldolase, class II